MTVTHVAYLDALYGDVHFGPEISDLVHSPVVQRLRHVRLSNIDSIAMPGIANLSRYEHVVGVACLATKIGIRRKIPKFDHLALIAASLLHDWAITAFGHLVEEAFHYCNVDFHHESKLSAILRGSSDVDTLGVNLQILEGRQTNLSAWARKVAGESRADELLRLIEETISGKGRFGQLVSGTMDLDNIDNVCRIAFHMGLLVDRSLPLRLAESIVDIDDKNGPIFSVSATRDVEAWVSTRRDVYQRLMLAQPDFSCKIMIIAATSKAIKRGEITSSDWTLTDVDLLARLTASADSDVRDTVSRWRAGESWDMTPLWWLPGQRPTYADLASFSGQLSEDLGRPCFAYGIKDKRERLLEFRFNDGSKSAFGSTPSTWLLGVGSSRRAVFSRAETGRIRKLAIARFAPFAEAVLATNINDTSREAYLL